MISNTFPEAQYNSNAVGYFRINNIFDIDLHRKQNDYKKRNGIVQNLWTFEWERKQKTKENEGSFVNHNKKYSAMLCFHLEQQTLYLECYPRGRLFWSWWAITTFDNKSLWNGRIIQIFRWFILSNWKEDFTHTHEKKSNFSARCSRRKDIWFNFDSINFRHNTTGKSTPKPLKKAHFHLNATFIIALTFLKADGLSRVLCLVTLT